MNNKSIIDRIVNSILDVLPKGKNFYPLHEPSFEGNEWKYLKECLDTGWVSSVGKYVDEFEKKLADFTGAKMAIAAVNGTSALQICLKIVGVTTGDEVLTNALTFVATSNAISYCGGIPHYVDSNEKTLGLCPISLRAYLKEIAELRNNECFNRKTGNRIKALVPMHVFGHPADIDPLLEVANEFSISAVEDAAESLGSYYKGKHTGTFGKISALSFNGNKTITTGGGGAILTNDSELGRLAKHLTTTAKVPHKWEFFHDMIGYNFRLPNICAALGCAQLEQLPGFIQKKRMLAEKYKNAFNDIPEVRFVTEPSFGKSNYWLNTLIFRKDFSHLRDDLLEKTNSMGIQTRPAWRLNSDLPMFQNCPKMALPVAEYLEKSVVNIPSSSNLIPSE
ncbi:MAG: LegC family aminotransferase [Candidatus Riflebacteria bacterium]|nr:LegC family aminotransferase [Candidatus Riflebacteria bacterium]